MVAVKAFVMFVQEFEGFGFEGFFLLFVCAFGGMYVWLMVCV